MRSSVVLSVFPRAAYCISGFGHPRASRTPNRPNRESCWNAPCQFLTVARGHRPMWRPPAPHLYGHHRVAAANRRLRQRKPESRPLGLTRAVLANVRGPRRAGICFARPMGFVAIKSCSAHAPADMILLRCPKPQLSPHRGFDRLRAPGWRRAFAASGSVQLPCLRAAGRARRSARRLTCGPPTQPSPAEPIHAVLIALHGMGAARPLTCHSLASHGPIAHGWA